MTAAVIGVLFEVGLPVLILAGAIALTSPAAFARRRRRRSRRASRRRPGYIVGRRK